MISTLLCPRCKKPLQYCEGDQVNPKNGITIWCEDCLDCGGHGKNEAAALEIFKQKLGFRNG